MPGGLVLDRDHNAAINIPNKVNAGAIESYARGEAVRPNSSLNQEAPPLRAEQFPIIP